MPLIRGYYANIFLVVLVMIEQLSFSGIIFGFNSLLQPYSKIKVFFHLCPNPEVNGTNGNDTTTEDFKCDKQTDMFAMAFIIWTVVVNLGALPVGFFYDRFGIRFTKMVGAVLFLIGCSCFALTSEKHPYFLFPAGILCAMSCQFLMICNLQVSQIFPRYLSILVSLVCGAFDSSSVIFELIRLSNQAGISLKASFFCLGISGFVLEMSTAGFLFPYQTSGLSKLAAYNEKPLKDDLTKNNNLKNDEPKYLTDEKKSLVDITGDKNNLDEIKFKPAVEDNEIVLLENDELVLKVDEDSTKRYPSLKSCVFSRFFFFHILFFSFSLLRFTYFITSLEKLLIAYFDKSDFVSIISKLSFFLFSGILVAPLAGFLIDFMRAKSKISNHINSDIAYWLSLRPLVAAISICCLASLLMSFMVFFADKFAIYAAYVFLVICRAFLFSSQSASLLMAFPLKYFGTLFGIAFFTSGLFSSIQYALLKLSSVSLIATNIILVVFSLLSFIHPIQIFLGVRISCKRSTKPDSESDKTVNS